MSFMPSEATTQVKMSEAKCVLSNERSLEMQIRMNWTKIAELARFLSFPKGQLKLCCALMHTV